MKVLKALEVKGRSLYNKSTAKAVLSRVFRGAEQDDHLILHVLEAAERTVAQAVEKEVTTIFHDLHQKPEPPANLSNRKAQPDDEMANVPVEETTKSLNVPAMKSLDDERSQWTQVLDKHGKVEDFLTSLDVQGFSVSKE